MVSKKEHREFDEASSVVIKKTTNARSKLRKFLMKKCRSWVTDCIKNDTSRIMKRPGENRSIEAEIFQSLQLQFTSGSLDDVTTYY